MNKNKFLTRNICQKCSEKQENCCTYYVPLTIDDIKRITELGFALNKFAKVSMYTKEEIKNEEDWWIDSLININGRLFRLTTKTKKNGQCFFLTDKMGCLLGGQRPWECKIYPFWIENNKLIFQDESCYLVKRFKSIKKGLKLINENEQKIKSYFLKIKKDFLHNKKIHEKIVKKLKKITWSH